MADESRTPLRTRIAAGMGAILFFVTASALTIAVVVDSSRNKDAANKPDTTASTCEIKSVEGQPTLSAPEGYKPAGDVTKLETTDLEVGSGATAKAGDCLVMKYYGTLASDSTVFDENFTKTTALQTLIGKGSVIQGWDQGVPGMKVGGTRRLVIPSDLAYGPSGQGSIPANADLIFVVKLLEIKK